MKRSARSSTLLTCCSWRSTRPPRQPRLRCTTVGARSPKPSRWTPALRVGLVTARVLGAALGVPAYGVCTLDAIARAAVTAAAGREFLVATDARRKEVYWARYSAAGRRILGPDVGKPAGLDPAVPAAGEGPRLYPESFGDPIGPRYPAASMLAGLAAEGRAAGAALPPAEPLYLRRPDARVPGPPKRVSPA
jgi:tRNA A37 threonylcarbamoyladenosine modification protein TsaB